MIQVLKFYLFSFLENSFPEYEFPGNFQLVQYNQQPPSYEEISQPLPHQQQVPTIVQSQQLQCITPEEVSRINHDCLLYDFAVNFNKIFNSDAS